jgi:hypothetical protein
MEGSGRDPLGLSRVSDNFTDLLLPSIITTTNRARYYSFYPWALRESLESLGDDDGTTDFIDEFRKREAAFAIASKLGKETDFSIVGIDQVNLELSKVSEEDSITTVFKVLPANPWGGFGQYYGGCLQGLGLGNWAEDGFWHVSTKRGSKLADEFAKSVAGTSYVGKNCGNMETVPLQILRESSSDFSLDGIRHDDAKDERILLTQMFFDLDEDAQIHGSSHRQATLGQLLHVLDAYESIESAPTRKDVAGSCLYWPHYYGCLYGSNGRSVPYAANSIFSETSAYWRQFCAHQFFTYAAEELLQAILDAISKTAEGLTKTELVEALLATGFAEELDLITNRNLSGPAALLQFFGAGENSEQVQARFSANHPLAEWWIYSGDSEKPISTRLGRAFAILAQLHSKWRRSEDAALEDVEEKADGEWWLGTCFEWGDSWLSEDTDWTTAISELIDEVHSHHELVKFQKHKLDAAWVEKTGDRYSKLQDLNPEFRSNRHGNAAMILQDLCVLKDGGNDDHLLLTAWGRSILKNVIKARS